MIDLHGKKALVTGGSRGIGQATAVLLAQAGCDVAINYLHREDLAQTVKESIQNIGKECLIYKMNLGQKEDILKTVENIIGRWGQIDILVNNAGIWTYGEVGNMEDDVWDETIKINLSGVYHTCSAVVPHMKKRKRGWIVNVSSTAGVRGEAFHSHYAASKGALIAFTKSLAVELASSGIRVNCVSPGWVDTDMCTESFSDPDFRKKIENIIPLNRIPDPVDIAGPILFLTSELACHITGENLNVNGGAVLCG
ncbi:MAG: SDR family oxidoreductase [Candidatus Aminicenantes bacterium]|nr:SDR family oxidoreductase [Candidatus Aminicenantes bacterium]